MNYAKLAWWLHCMCRRLAHVEADRCAVMRRHAALLRLDAVWGHQESGDGLV